MNDEQRLTAFARFTNALIEYAPTVVITSIVAVMVFVFGLWLNYWGLSRDVKSIIDSRNPTTFCGKVRECSIINGIAESIIALNREDVRTNVHFQEHEKQHDELKIRVGQTEQRFYALATKPDARYDPFTGSEGRDLKSHIDELHVQYVKLEERVRKLEQRQ